VCGFDCVLVQEEKAKEEAAAAAPADKGKEAGEKKDDGGGGEEKKEDAPPPPPPPPEEVVMRVFMHCEGCARKVKKCLKGFDGNGFSCSLPCFAIVPLCSCFVFVCFFGTGEVFIVCWIDFFISEFVGHCAFGLVLLARLRK
jgi:hypothetical protein